MKIYATVDLSALVGAEVRVLDGEECLYVPIRYNPCICFLGGHPTLLMDVVELRQPDKDGYTHAIVPHVPKAIAKVIPEADYHKMTQPIGRAKGHGRPKNKIEPEPAPGLGPEQLAQRPVTDDEIPL